MRATPLTILACAAALALGCAWLFLESHENPAFLAPNETDATLLAYTLRDPVTDGRVFIGQPDAPLTAVLYVTPGSAETIEFLDTRLTILEAPISAGRLRLTIRVPLLASDIEHKTDSYWAAKAFLCLAPEDASQMVALARRSTREEFLNTATLEGMTPCMEGPDPAFLAGDVAESRILGVAMTPALFIGIAGRDTTVLTGVPSAARLQRAIRLQETIIGV